MSNYYQIAIDGPVGVGKSTVSRRLAEMLGFVYVDTGAMYRVVTLMALRLGIPVDDEQSLYKLAKSINIDIRLPSGDEQDGRQCTVLVDGEDVSWEIRKGRVNKYVTEISRLKKVRGVLVSKQSKIAKEKNVVMEGRDIASVVLPNADLKIYLDASEQVRTERFYQSRSAKKGGLSREQVAVWLRERDIIDINRIINPLKIVPDAWVIDSTDLTLEEVVSMIVGRVKEDMEDGREN